MAALCRSGFYHLLQLRPVLRSLTHEAARTLVPAFISSRLDYCNSLLYCCTAQSFISKFSPSRMQLLGFSPELDEGTTSRQFFISCTGFLSRDMSTSSWHISFTRLCLARHLRTWLMTYTWFRMVQEVYSARPPTDRVLFHGRTTHLATEVLLPPDRVFGAASQYRVHSRDEDISYKSFRRELKMLWF